MKSVDRTHTIIWQFCYLICLLIFLVWLNSAVRNYLTNSASSSVSLKIGDNGDKLVHFPVLTFCKEIDPMHGKIWRDVNPCKTEFKEMIPPFFFAYLIDCLEDPKNTKNITTLVNGVS